jgi:hypothetical protein
MCLEVGCCSTAIIVGPIIEVMRFTFLVTARQCLKHPRTFISLRMNLPSMVSAVQSSTASCVNMFAVSLLFTSFTRRGLVTTFSWKMRGLSAKRARSICDVHLLPGAARPKMEHVTCKHVRPGVGSMRSPKWSVHCVRTGCSP